MTIPQQEYHQRREQLMAKVGNSTALFRSAPMAVMHNDVEYSFRQDSDFFYFTGFNEPEAVAVIAPHHDKHKFVLFVQPKDPEMETWTGYRVGVEGAKELYGADEAYSITELKEKLPQYLEKAHKIYYHFGRDRIFNDTVLQMWQKLLRTYSRRGTGPIALEDTMHLSYPLRMVKTPQELELMRKAINISVAAHNHAQEMAKPGIYEYQVQAEMEYIFRKEGGFGPAYPSIVASGANACILHYGENSRKMEEGDLLLIDAGCCYGYYNGDITRTFPVSGKFTPEQQAIYEIVLKAQEEAIVEVQEGKAYHEYHDRAVKVIVEGLVALGLLVGDIEELIKEEKYKPFYMHRTGHWLGLDVHDVGYYKQTESNWQILQAGNILTVEPGIYIAPDIKVCEGQPDVPEQWRGIGVRIEDDVLVTSNGPEVLSAGVPK